jgi:hypothetical protein
MVLAMAPLPTPAGLADGLALKDRASTPKRGFTPVATGTHRRLHGSPVPADPAKGARRTRRFSLTRGALRRFEPGKNESMRTLLLSANSPSMIAMSDCGLHARGHSGAGTLFVRTPLGPFYRVPETRLGVPAGLCGSMPTFGRPLQVGVAGRSRHHGLNGSNPDYD